MQKSHRHTKFVQGEVTIKDFADRTTRGGRPKKSLNKFNLKTLKTSTDSSVDINFNIAALNINDDDEMDDDEIKNKTIKKKRKNKEMTDPNHVYNDYHIDIWFLISEHIKPEDTGRFALICKKTEAVVCSAKYWLNLYRRFYNPKLRLPDRLKPDRMNRVGGLRARVICALFFMYPNFSLRLSKPDRNNYSCLENLLCYQMFYRTVKEGIWMFCYRFSNRIKVRKPIKMEFKSDSEDSDGDSANEMDILDRLETFLAEHNNVFENRYEGQHLLVVTTDRFIPFPDFLSNPDLYSNDITLQLIRQPLSKDLRHTGLELNFVNYQKLPVAKTYYEKILEYRVIHWWDPEFNLFSDF